MCGEAHHTRPDHKKEPEYRAHVNFYEEGKACIPDHILFNDSHTIRKHHYYVTVTVITPTTTATLE